MAGSDFDCSVCFEKFTPNSNTRLPRLLSCGHTFCTACLTGMSFKRQIRCPTCRQITDAKTEIGKCLKANYLVISLLNSQEFQTQLCEAEDCTNAAELWCRECEMSICGECSSEIHEKSRFARFRKHVVVAKKHKVVVPKCEEHDENMKLYCLTDETLICILCEHHGRHKGHNVKLVSVVSKEHRQNLSARLTTLKCVHDDAQKLLLRVSSKTEELESELIIEVEKTFARLRQALDERKQELLNQIRTQHTKQTKDAISQKETNSTLCDQLESLIGNVETLLSSNDYSMLSCFSQIIVAIKSMEQRARETTLKETSSPKLHLDLDSKSLENLQNQIKQFGVICTLSAVKSVFTFSVKSKSIILKWESIPWNSEANAIKYEIKKAAALKASEFEDDGKADWELISVIADKNEVEIKELKPLTLYGFKVRGIFGDTKGEWSKVRTVKTPKGIIRTKHVLNLKHIESMYGVYNKHVESGMVFTSPKTLDNCVLASIELHMSACEMNAVLCEFDSNSMMEKQILLAREVSSSIEGNVTITLNFHVKKNVCYVLYFHEIRKSQQLCIGFCSTNACPAYESLGMKDSIVYRGKGDETFQYNSGSVFAIDWYFEENA